ncbi:MAG: glycosyltransferase family 4 protein [Desulfobacteraceae bacterium]|nr:glycosyltransferase family 4 protein [Desulfobacteraceae bacterium]MBC2757654.1 glycosyltransferase family 4 protein [Desulfobacteraceae bacterium]MBC2763899.1 glycosyltransferase family 4 protein [ANME-2 cluster archaeon]
MKKNIIIAFGSVPKDGGTFTFYRTLRPELLKYGIDLRCVSVGKAEADLIEDAFVDDGCVLLAETITDVKEQAKAFTDWCEETGIDIVFAINSVAILSALPHLPEKIRVMARCANAFDHGYKITVSCYERLTRIVTTAPRHGLDLINAYGVDRDRIHMIPNGIDPSLFEGAAQNQRGEDSVLRLGFLGRLEHNQKGVLFLPEILRYLQNQGIKFTCKIAGKGVHGKAFEAELKSFFRNKSVELVGALKPSEVPDFLGSVDVYLFPSQFEGCPNALLEAIMAGCVPVSWKLEGITDFIIKDGDTGFVCPMADCEAFAARIAEFSEHRDRLEKMSAAAAYDARERFSQARVAADYARLIKDVMHMPQSPWTPLPWSFFRLDPAFANYNIWQSILPKSFSRIIKNCLFYVGLSDRYYD